MCKNTWGPQCDQRWTHIVATERAKSQKILFFFFRSKTFLSSLWAKLALFPTICEEELKSLLMKVKEES